jgi:hypothetical protein
MTKYIQFTHQDDVDGFVVEDKSINAVEFSITDDVQGKEFFFHMEMSNLAGLEQVLEEGEDYAARDGFREKAEKLRQGEIEYFIGALHYPMYYPNIEVCNQCLNTAYSIFDIKAPQLSPYYADVFVRETQDLTTEVLLGWLKKISAAMFRKKIDYAVGDREN